MVPEAKLEETDAGLVPVSAGWFVVNARDARWFHREGRHSVSLTGKTEWEADTLFPMLGVQLAVLEPGEPNSLYHWETETEAFLVLSGEALLIVEGQERPMRQWDFAHCPPKTEHVVVGAGDGPCIVLAMSSRENQAVRALRRVHRERGRAPLRSEPGRDHRGRGRGRSDAGWTESQPSRYREGWLPS